MPFDVALVWNNQTGTADFAMAGPDLQADAGLETAVILSLFVDRQAAEGDAIPDGSGDPRGWWGDAPIDATPTTGNTPDRIGSRLWLLDRARAITDTLRRAEAYAREALHWIVEDGVAGSIAVTASFPHRGWLQLDITINQAGSSPRFAFAWNAQFAN